MTLVTSGLAVAGLCAVAIPILIHLLARQRRKPVEWAAMRFLLEAFRKHKRRLQLEQLILLAVRCLIVGLLGLALARPILQGAGLISTGGSRAVYLVIDDGMASGIEAADHQAALARHVKQAAELINGLGPGDAVGLITAARPAQALLMPPSTDHGAAVDLLKSLTSKETPTDLPGAFGMVRAATDDARKEARQTAVYLFSEFRAGSASLDSPLPPVNADAAQPIQLFATPPAADSVSNIQVTSIEPVRSVVLPNANDGSGQVTVRLRRTGAKTAGDVSRVRLSGEGLPAIEPKTVSWTPGQSTAEARFTLNFGAALDRKLGVTASIDDDALGPDNRAFTVLDLRTQLRVLLVDRRSFGFERSLDRLTAGQWIRRALEPQEKGPIQVVEVEPAALDIADVRTADVVIVPRPDLLTDGGWPVLQKFLGGDGLVMIMPPAEANVHQWTERMGRELGLPWKLSLEVKESKDGIALADEQPPSELLHLISTDLPELARPVLAYRLLPVDITGTSASPLVSFADGSPLAVAGPASTSGNGASGPAASEPAATSPNAKPIGAGRGMVVYLACAPELSWTNLPSKPLMVPLFHEIVRQGLGVIQSSQKAKVGGQPALASPAARMIVSSQGAKVAVNPDGRASKPIDRSGLYDVQDASQQPVGKLAVNVDPAAGSADVQSEAAVSAWLKASGPWKPVAEDGIAATLGNQGAGSPIAGALLLIVLGLAALETVLARRFSHAYANKLVDDETRFLSPGLSSAAEAAASKRPAA